MAEATKQDPNFRSDAQKRQDQERLIAKRAEEDKAAAAAKALQAGGVGMVSEAPKERKVDPLDAARMSEAQFLRTEYIITAGEGVQPEDLVSPGYWAHVGEKLRPWSEITARANDGTWYAKLLVLEAGRNWAKVHMLSCARLTTIDVALTQAELMSPYEVKFRGPHCQWSVLRKSDGAVLIEQLGTQDAGIEWMRGRLKADR